MKNYSSFFNSSFLFVSGSLMPQFSCLDVTDFDLTEQVDYEAVYVFN